MPYETKGIALFSPGGALMGVYQTTEMEEAEDQFREEVAMPEGEPLRMTGYKVPASEWDEWAGADVHIHPEVSDLEEV